MITTTFYFHLFLFKQIYKKSFATASSVGGTFLTTNNLSKVYLIYFSLDKFKDFSTFKDTFLTKSLPFNNYTVYIKVRYDLDNFFMCGNQFGFDYNESTEIKDLYDNINIKLEDYFANYNLADEDIVYIQVTFRSLVWRMKTDLIIDKDQLRSLAIVTKKRTLDLVNIPISIQVNNLPKPLKVTLDNNNNITQIFATIKSKEINFMEFILDKTRFLKQSHKDIITQFDSNYKFYYVYSGIDYILAINNKDPNNIVKLKYSTSGVLLSKIIDNKLDDNSIIRTRNNQTIYIKDNTIVSSSTPIKFKPLNKVKIKYNSWIPNPNIGVIDTETYKNDNTHEIYALGFITNLDTKPKLFYIDNDYNSHTLVLKFIDELMASKYNNINFYCHNLGGYDVVFIIKIINDYNENVDNESKYKLYPLLRDDKIIKLTIKKNHLKVTLLDSFCVLSNSLEKLAQDFNVKTKKSIFPYKFAVKENLFYIGNTPSIDQYNHNITIDQYNSIYSQNWSFKDQTLEYLQNDVNSLYEVIVKANNQIHSDYKINIMESSTISGLAMKIFLSKYYNDNIPMIIKPSIYKDIKQGYYGGITEVYRPYGENLFYYDVNSLYPYAALSNMPGLSCTKINYFNNNENINNLFGFFHCDITSPHDIYLGLLPIRNKLGIECPKGQWSGWYFSEELKFAQENGYTIKVNNGYIFNEQNDVFSNYIYNIYKIKSNPTSITQKLIAKSLLNNLLGRFGINLNKAITKIVSEDTFSELSVMNKITSYKQIGDNKYIVSYIPALDPELIKSHGLDILKVLNKYNDKEIQEINNSSIAITAAVTAYARIHMTKLKLYILSLGGKIYYSDTDSIVTDIKLNNNMVDPDILGKLKLEHKLKKGIFITNKTYCFINDQDVFINKSKGVKSFSLNYEDYEKLLDNKNVYTGIKTQSKLDWEKGDVSIFDKNITINSNSYTKRKKIYINNIWVDTKPNTIIRSYHTNRDKNVYRNYFDKSLIVYSPKNLIIQKDITMKNKLNNNNSNKITDKGGSYNNYWNIESIKKEILSGGLGIFIIVTLLMIISYISKSFIEEDINIEINENEVRYSIESGNELTTTPKDNITSTHKIEEVNSFNNNKAPEISSFDNELSDILPNDSYSKDIFERDKYIGEDIRDLFNIDCEDTKINENKNKSVTWDSLITDNKDRINIKESSVSLDSNDLKTHTLNHQNLVVKTDETSESIDNKNYSPFTPFTPNTLLELKKEINNTTKELQSIANNVDILELTKSERETLITLLEERKYFLDQEQKHLEAVKSSFKNDQNTMEELVEQSNKLLFKVATLKKDTILISNKIKENIAIEESTNNKPTEINSTNKQSYKDDHFEDDYGLKSLFNEKD